MDCILRGEIVSDLIRASTLGIMKVEEIQSLIEGGLLKEVSELLETLPKRFYHVSAIPDV